MVQLLDTLIAAVCGFAGLIVLRWLWFRRERRRLLKSRPLHDDMRFEVVRSDEDDQTFSGRVIRRLRTRVIEGRVEIHWQFHPQFIHKGFVLTGKCRSNQGPWEPLAFEPYQDSGSWIECFNLGESRSYVFTIKKTYRFFFGLVRDDEVEVVYDQISFSVRKGRYLKEKAELMHDRAQLLTEVKQYAQLENDIRAAMRGPREPRVAPPTTRSPVESLESRFNRRSSLSDFVETKRAEILAHPSWSDERKRAEIDKLEELAEEAALEEAE